MTRQEAIEKIEICQYKRVGTVSESELEEALDMAIEALTEPKWIPCSERLPKYRQIVIVSSFWGVKTAYRDSVREDGTDDYWELIERDSTADPVYIYAWMPLPEPYEESDEQ